MLEQIVFPEPVIHVAVEPKTKADQDKMGKALYSLSEEDPTFTVRTDEETGQTVISGMGELHLEVLVDRMLREFNVEATVGKPQVAYRETITETVEKHRYTHKKQTGGSGQFADVIIMLEPTGPGGGYEFDDKITGGRIPKEYIPAVDQGIQPALTSGVLAGYPLVDVKATLLDGCYHDVDSSEMAFKIAGPWASRKPPARPSPCCSSRSWPSRSSPPRTTWATSWATFVAPGPARRHRAAGQRHGHQGHVPLSEMFGYATDLRIAHPGSGHLHDAVRQLPADAEQRPGRDRQRVRGE